MEISGEDLKKIPRGTLCLCYCPDWCEYGWAVGTMEKFLETENHQGEETFSECVEYAIPFHKDFGWPISNFKLELGGLK